ncbi:hypothetical protein [Clavibacter michiganensis]|uniref:Uncharacterized protein n=1 Tax=Clavibacter michiganensis TaxID=28447 RepID=A0A251YN62_9MICO|nr:hypothetical protein [Clavibacter michiganensis]OUE25603.1 hypothetical protein BFL37_06350 [Clavibacter michiganensis]
MTDHIAHPAPALDLSGAVAEQAALTDALTLKRVTDTAWQVCDSRRAPGESGHLLGFVETVGDEIEMMQLGRKFVWTRFASMRDALAHIVATAAAMSASQDEGELAWVCHALAAVPAPAPTTV